MHVCAYAYLIPFHRQFMRRCHLVNYYMHVLC
jgi:hypothetical protein